MRRVEGFGGGEFRSTPVSYPMAVGQRYDTAEGEGASRA